MKKKKECGVGKKSRINEKLIGRVPRTMVRFDFQAAIGAAVPRFPVGVCCCSAARQPQESRVGVYTLRIHAPRVA